jgi:hypothetical protein
MKDIQYKMTKGGTKIREMEKFLDVLICSGDDNKLEIVLGFWSFYLLNKKAHNNPPPTIAKFLTVSSFSSFAPHSSYTRSWTFNCYDQGF